MGNKPDIFHIIYNGTPLYVVDYKLDGTKVGDY